MGFGQGGQHVEEEGLAVGAGLLGAVQDGDGAGRLRDGPDDLGGREGTEQVQLDEAELVSLGVETVDGVLDGAGAGTHADHDLGGLGIAVVLDEVVLASDDLGELVHEGLDDARHALVVLVRGLAGLEVGVGVLGGAADERVGRGQGALPVGVDKVVSDEVTNVVV